MDPLRCLLKKIVGLPAEFHRFPRFSAYEFFLCLLLCSDRFLQVILHRFQILKHPTTRWSS